MKSYIQMEAIFRAAIEPIYLSERMEEREQARRGRPPIFSSVLTVWLMILQDG